MNCRHVKFSAHAIRQMFERRISKEEVLKVIKDSETIGEYADDFPFPSRLALGVVEGRPLHVVVALNPDGPTCIVITAYEPTTEVWSNDFKTRRKKT